MGVECMNEKIYNYVMKNIFAIIISAGFILAVYGIKLCTPSTSIDNEAVISVRDSIYFAWLSMGRIGLVGLKKLCGQYIYNPIFSMAILVLGMLVSTVIWGMIFDSVAQKDKKQRLNPWIFSTILFTSPIIAEQFGFVMQAVEVLIAIDLCGVGLYFFFLYFSREKRIIYLLLNITMSMLAFSVYQALTVVYVTAAVGMFILYISQSETAQRAEEEIWRLLVTLVISFFVSYFLYYVASKFMMAYLEIEATDYTMGQMFWKTNSVKECITFLLEYIRSVVLGETIFYSISYLILVCLMTVMCLLKNREDFGGKYYLYVLAHIALFITPFLMGIILGGAPFKRTVLSMPLMLAFGYMYLYYRICECIDNKKVLALITFIIAIVPFNQASESSRLYYTEYISNKEQEMIATKLSYRIEEVTGQYAPDSPVVFVGSLALQRNPSCYTNEELELVGQGFFETSFSTSHGTFLNINYMKTLGMSYVMPSDEQVSIAENAAMAMPCWPSKGSVQEVDGVVVVKLN